MNYCFLCNDFFVQYKNTDDIKTSIKNYIYNNYNTLKDIYFEPKKIEKSKIEEIINSIDYQKVILDTITNLNNINLNEVFSNIVNELANTLEYNGIDKKVYVIIGLNTTTIYSTKYQNEDVTVILLESTLGLEENIKMLLAHEYTHWVREKEIKYDIFEKCIGERLITEGIACNFSEEIVPNKQKSYYTIVPSTTVEWVKNNIETLDKVVEKELDKNNMMYDFFYIFAKTKIPNMPVRTGYVYGYIMVVATKYKQGNKEGYYDIPGGKIEDGELSEQIAIREMKEETGLDVKLLQKEKILSNIIVLDRFFIKGLIDQTYNFKRHIEVDEQETY